MDAGALLGVVGGVLGAWALLLVWLWLARPRDAALRDLVAVVPDLVRLVRGLLADRATPRGVRLALWALLAWLLNPIDLIPEFIPVLGPLDDVIVAVLVLRFVRRRLGTEELRKRWPGTEAGYAVLERVLGRDRS